MPAKHQELRERQRTNKMRNGLPRCTSDVSFFFALPRKGCLVVDVHVNARCVPKTLPPRGETH